MGHGTFSDFMQVSSFLGGDWEQSGLLSEVSLLLLCLRGPSLSSVTVFSALIDPKQPWQCLPSLQPGRVSFRNVQGQLALPPSGFSVDPFLLSAFGVDMISPGSSRFPTGPARLSMKYLLAILGSSVAFFPAAPPLPPPSYAQALTSQRPWGCCVFVLIRLPIGHVRDGTLVPDSVVTEFCGCSLHSVHSVLRF